MAIYTTLRTGSSGSEVEKLQNALMAAGYDVGSSGADGKYGTATEAAVRQYQEDNGLSVDGVAGDQTQGALYGSQTSNNANSAPETGTEVSGGVSNGGQTTQQPTISQTAYEQALAALQAAQKETPHYAGTHEAQLQEIYNSIIGRDKFSYDLNADMLYNQYRDQYVQQGQMAMMDAMGQASALTGGYGNSYAQAVGQQAYQGYLQQLNDVVPDLYALALDQHNREGDDLLNQYAMVEGMRDDEYGKYQDQLNEYWTNIDFLQGQADNEYQKQQDAFNRLADLIAGTGYSPSAEELAAAGMTSSQASGYKKAYTDSQAASSGGGGGGGGGSSYSSKTAATQQMLRNAGYNIAVDGIWGPKTQAAYDDYYSKGSSSGFSNSSSKPATKAQETASKATYTTGELIEAAAAGYTKKQVLKILAARGVDTNSAAVKADVDYAFSR